MIATQTVGHNWRVMLWPFRSPSACINDDGSERR